MKKSKLFIAIFSFVAFTFNSFAQNITSISGTGASLFSGDGGPANSAAINQPRGVCVDASGNVYIADYTNNRIRKITASTGIITTIAGTTASGSSGDGGPATSAKLYGPYGVWVDASYNVYIADYWNHKIRKITASTGIMSTVAGSSGASGFSGDGGPATFAKLNFPTSVCADASGNVYIADGNNFRIRKVTASTGIISTIAGNGTSTFSGDGGPAVSAGVSLYGICVDASGNLYFTDYNYRIRKITASTGIVTTIGGDGTLGTSGDGGLATSAKVKYARGICVDVSGNVYFTDEGAHTIRKITSATGIISTIAGNGTQSFSGDGGPAISAGLNSPDGVSVAPSGNIYIADTNNHRIRKAGAGPNCFAHDTASYDSVQNNFTLTVDSATTALAIGYHWDFGDGATSTLATPTHTFTIDALYNVCMKIYTATGDSCTYCHIIGKDASGNIIRTGGFTLNVQNANTTTGISQTLSDETKISIFPNPTTGVFTMQIGNEQLSNNHAQLTIYNVLGERVYSLVNAQLNTSQIDLSNQPNGIYFINLKTEKKIISKKIIINN